MDQWKYVKYAKRGLQHAKSGVRIQSNVEINEDSQSLAAVLCAGDESLDYSEVAAAAVSSGICSLLLKIGQVLDQFDPEDDEQIYQIKAMMIQRARKVISKQAQSLGIESSRMDCNLSFVLISKTENLAITGNLGNSAVCLIRKFGSVLISSDENSQSSVLQEDAVDGFKLKMLNLDDTTVYGFILTTKGLENEIYSSTSAFVKKNAEKYFNAVLASHPEQKIDSCVQKLTASPKTQYQDDICTAVLSRAEKAIKLDDDPTWLCTCGRRNDLSCSYCSKCGMEYKKLYGSSDFRKYGGKEALFRKLNSSPKQEKEFLETCAKSAGIRTTNEPKPARQPSVVSNEPTIQQAVPSAEPSAQNQNDSMIQTIEEKPIKVQQADAGLRKHTRIITVLCALIGCLLIAFIALAIVHFKGKEPNTVDENIPVEIDDSENQQEQERKPIRFH